jgi:hypothetical protein
MMNHNTTICFESPAHQQAASSGPPADGVTGIAPDETPGAPTRELAQRMSGTVEVRLLWHPGMEQVELSVYDPADGVGFRVEVGPGDAIDAFDHPYTYAGGCKRAVSRGAVFGC